ncbi:hypothetical protein [Marivita hallyeonensis]|uniref:Dihydroxy-acid dehydratase n=1 Tax=Marivita hallyeonensis TaxID=996342 RepID=A0A1M5T9Q9_9RHOB|nr:hypothetical protein [Marivita hallyeonensis]SHH47452.1 hypothetical protein SAMN05443551_2140 [Marivita hallyeonensis]
MIRKTKLWATLAGAALLAGCDATGTGGSLSFLDASTDPANFAAASAQLAGGAIVVSGPDGYCVDASTLRATRVGGFAAVASCNILSGGETGPIVEPVLVTVTVSRATGPAPEPSDLARALGTELLSNREMSAIIAGRMASGGETAFQGSDPRHWRGAFTLGPHMIGLALYAPQGSPLVGAQGAAFLNTVSSRIRANSAPAEQSAEQSQTTPDPITAGLGRLFGRGDLQ